MKHLLLKTWLVMLMMCVGMSAWAESVTYTFADVASENSWTNGTAYTDVTLDNFHFVVSGGGNNGKYYTSDNTWRFYSGGGLKITATDGSTITAVSSNPSKTFSSSNGEYSISGAVNFKSITITYTPVIKYTITAATSNSTWGTVSLDGRVITATPKSGYRISKSSPYTVTSGTATVIDNKNNTFTVEASSNCTVQINFEAIPSYNYAFYSNGVKLSDGSKYEGEAIVFPADPEAINGKVFVGWAESTIDGTTNEKPVVVRSKNMGTVDVNFYAVFATQSGGGTESTSISAYADGEYYIVDFYENKYYAFSGAVANKKLTGVEVTSAVTANPDGSISVNLNNASLTDEMPYAISLAAGNYTITNTKAGSDVILQKGGNDLGTEVSDPAIYWTGFEEGTDAQAGRFSITASGTNSGGSNTNNCLLLQTSNWDSKASVQSPTLTVKGYVQSNRGNVTAKSQCYASGYMWFVPTTAISYSDYCTTVSAPTATITLNAACNDGSKVYSTYSNASAWVVPAELEVSEVGVNGEGKLQVVNYTTGDVVPANTGVMVSADKWAEGNTKDFTITLSNAAGTSVLNEDNCLRPTGAGITADAMADADADCTYYRLTMHNGTQIGFWWGAAEGAAFALAANKAYLAVPNSSGARVQSFWFGEETAIEAVKSEQSNGVRYNMAGQRVGAGYKGIVIVNGKKMLNK